MGSTHGTAELWSGQTLSAGGGEVQSPTVNLSQKYGCLLTGTITNGATGPTVPAEVRCETSPNGTDKWRQYGGKWVASTGNSDTTDFFFEVEDTVMYARLVAGNNTGRFALPDFVENVDPAFNRPIDGWNVNGE